jgi:hypothetical protein
MKAYPTRCSIAPQLAGTGAPFGAAADRRVVSDRHMPALGRELWNDIGAGTGTGGHTP